MNFLELPLGGANWNEDAGRIRNNQNPILYVRCILSSLPGDFVRAEFLKASTLLSIRARAGFLTCLDSSMRARTKYDLKGWLDMSVHVSLTPGAITPTVDSHRVGEFPHCAVIGQRGSRIRLLQFRFRGLTHSQPPHAFYNELPAPTATKC
jgi:hypothetical protein